MKTILFQFVLLTCSISVFANQTLKSQIEDFHRDPASYMERLPVKSYNNTPFSISEIQSGEYLTSKDKLRKTLCRQIGNRRTCPTFKERSYRPFAAIETSPQNIETFIEGGSVVRNIRTMDEMREAQISQTPWSDTYWPLSSGALGHRFADPNFPGFDWLANFNYANKIDIFAENPKDRLSPSEKYDVLVGDRQKSLTNSMWNQGRYYHEAYGSVEGWMGLCHGWAPASYMLARPKQSVVVKTDNPSEEIRFLPSDVKGLATLLWASGNTNTIFLGGRCNDKNPRVDENGRIIDSECFDTSPGLFHILIVNRIKQSRPFIFDAAYDYQVWNQPVLGYSYTYFNPQTLEETEQIDKAIVPANEYARDKFKRYRSPQTKFVVGVGLRVLYLSETQPSTSQTNGPKDDNSVWTQYVYDLELDENLNIIGGEWYNRAHPDFVWTPELGSRALSVGDYQLQGEWLANQPVPTSWRTAAFLASRQSQPLAHIVESLINWAQ